MGCAFGTPEVLVSYETRGVLRWSHSDGRRGSDPVGKDLSDGEAIRLAEEKCISLGGGVILNLCIEDDKEEQ